MLKQITRLFSSGQSRSKVRTKRAASAKKVDYSCVEIKVRLDHCTAVEKMGGKRFLTAEAPWLPLPGCDRKQCKCRYARYDDRRMDTRRDIDIGITRSEYIGKDRRSYVRGRRQSDRLEQAF